MLQGFGDMNMQGLGDSTKQVPGKGGLEGPQRKWQLAQIRTHGMRDVSQSPGVW